jgi:hypothetical protein
MRKPAEPKKTNTDTAATPAAKPAAKAAAKPAAKPAAKAAAKAAAKPAAAKPALKAAAKPAVKAAAKPAAKTAAKPAAKPAASVAAKPAPKSAAKPAKAAKPKAAPVKADGADEPMREKAAKSTLVRDSFTMPAHEYEVLGKVKKACLKAGFEIKKSELLRIGVALISQMDMATLQRVLSDLPQLKTGRPKKI